MASRSTGVWGPRASLRSVLLLAISATVRSAWS